jgi:serine/threonine-protein kinase
LTVLIDGRYEVLAKIKDGGMGTVFKVRHVHLDEVRVVKVMRADILDDPDARARFVREARLAKGLHHENIAVLHDFAEDRDGSFYMVLEFVDGPSLAELLGSVGALPVGAAVDIAIQALSALEHLHRKGIVHRDVSPENVLLTLGENDRPLVKLIDLGIAKETAGEGLTMSGMFLGKLKYASPEQLGALAKGEVIDGRSDVYSLACVLYQLLTGQAPFRADTPQAYAMHHLMRSPRRFEETDREGRIPAGLRAAILKGVEKKRENRWGSAAEFVSVLASLRTSFHEGPEGERVVSDFVHRFRSERARMDALTSASTVGQVSGSRPPLSRTDDGPTPSANAGRPSGPRHAGTPTPLRLTAAPSVRRASGLRLAGVALGTVLLLGVGAGAAFLVWSRVQGLHARAAPRPDGTLVLTSSPWARVTSIVDESNGRAIVLPPSSTPLRLPLAEGRYRLALSGGPPGSGETTVLVSLSTGRETATHVDLPGFDIEETVRTYAP